MILDMSLEIFSKHLVLFPYSDCTLLISLFFFQFPNLASHSPSPVNTGLDRGNASGQETLTMTIYRKLWLELVAKPILYLFSAIPCPLSLRTNGLSLAHNKT